jgi:hypothetical protein
MLSDPKLQHQIDTLLAKADQLEQHMRKLDAKYTQQSRHLSALEIIKVYGILWPRRKGATVYVAL